MMWYNNSLGKEYEIQWENTENIRTCPPGYWKSITNNFEGINLSYWKFDWTNYDVDPSYYTDMLIQLAFYFENYPLR